jgi:hypothetical protein
MSSRNAVMYNGTVITAKASTSCALYSAAASQTRVAHRMLLCSPCTILHCAMYVRGIGDHKHELAYVGVLYKGCCNLRATATAATAVTAVSAVTAVTLLLAAAPTAAVVAAAATAAAAAAAVAAAAD